MPETECLCLPPTDFIQWNLIFDVMLFGWMWSLWEVVRIEPLWLEYARRRAHIASAMWGHSEKTAVYGPESRPSPDTDAIDTVTWISQSQLWELNFVIAAQKDQDSGTQ